MLLEQLIAETGIREERLLMYADSASKRYYSFTIKKRNGEDRWIRHPSRPLKSLQRWINSRFISGLNVHNSAMAYEPGSSIRTNALRHASSNFTLRLDFEDFFPSFKRKGITKFLKQNDGPGAKLNKKDIDFFSRIVTRYDELTIGAPSSPTLTNAMMFSFDLKVSQYCEGNGLIYTRYADDLFISARGPDELGGIVEYIARTAKDFPYARLRLNKHKTKFLSKKYRRSVTGLVITSDHRISIGRSKKREIHSLVHSASIGKLDESKAGYLQGFLAYCSDVEPRFFSSLRTKYGAKIIDQIMR